MSAEQIDIEAIFSAALKKRTAAERAAYLDGVCRDDAELRARVEALLKAHYEVDKSFLKSPPGVEGTLDNQVLSEGPGTRIGRYKLLELIGEGGFGVVYMAEQAEPIRRKVALKIIKLGMDTKQVIGRFEAERQALALMEHPNIAKVLDAGATETGRPYFVMELVRGISITEYCDKNSLDTQQRLKLFIEVCKAVQHAHQKGIIHRDIKPSNVMITLRDDDTGVPKIIDFGIAKATQKSLTEKTLFTEFKQFIGTPEYMSPEQARMGELDVDTRSDIYSLGVLLYELLTGTTPFDGEKLRSSAYDEMLKIIRETEPPKPSACLHTLGDMLTDVAKHRHANPAELCKIVRGDLDWVVMKALEKDRTRRYETANELAMDIERHLKDEPVVAGPPSRVYRMKKFVRRHRTAVISGLLVAVVLVGGIVASMIFALGQARARAQAQAVADFLKNDVLASVEPDKAKGPEVTVRYILDAASENIEGKFEDEPIVEASIRQTLGNAYQELGEYKAAQPHLEHALQVHQEQLGAEHPDTLKSMNSLANLYWVQARYDEAEQLHIKTLEIHRRVLGEEHPHTLTSMSNLAVVYRDQGRYDEAEHLHINRLEIERRVLGEEHPNTLASMNNLAVVYRDQGRYDEAEALCVKVLEGNRRVLGEEHPDTLYSMGNLANVYSDQSRYDEAESLYVKVLEIHRRVLGEEHPDTLSSMDNLAVMYSYQGRYDEAEQLHIKTLECKRRVLGEEHPDTLDSMENQANVYRDQGRYDEAESLYVKVLEIRRRVLGEEHPSTLLPMNGLGFLYLKQERYDEAEALYVKALEGHRRVLGEEHPNILGSMNNLGFLYRKQERYDEAEPLYVKVLEGRRRVLGEEHPGTLWTMNDLAWVYDKEGRYDEAESLYGEVLEIKRRVLGEEHPDTLWTMNNLAWLLATSPDIQLRNPVRAVELAKKVVEAAPDAGIYWNTLGLAYYRANQWEASIKALDKSIELRGPNSHDFFFLAMTHWQLGNRDEARQWYERAVEWIEQTQPNNEELARFRAEAAELLGISEPPNRKEVVPAETEDR